MIKIDKKVPLPKGKGAHHAWPFDKLRVNESFLVPIEPGQQYPSGLQTRIMQAANLRPNKKFTTRVERSARNKLLGVRCWRIK